MSNIVDPQPETLIKMYSGIGVFFLRFDKVFIIPILKNAFSFASVEGSKSEYIAV